jgi:hypothetical protein
MPFVTADASMQHGLVCNSACFVQCLVFSKACLLTVLHYCDSGFVQKYTTPGGKKEIGAAN